MAIRILLVDDHEIIREGMTALLRRHPEFEVVGQAADGRKALDLVKKLTPDVVIMDISMPNLNGIDAAKQILALNPDVKIMALSVHSDSTTIAKMIKAGASGYMLKESAFSELIDGLLCMMDGNTFLCSKVSKVIFNDYVNMINNPKWSGTDCLSTREREILQLVAEGNTTKDIAKVLNLSPKTVDSHREHIMEKLDVRNVAGLTKYAIREGLTST